MTTNKVTNTDAWLRRGWHPVARAADVGDEPRRVQLLGEAWVVVRLDGAVRAFRDECPHRGARLSDGCVVDGNLQCPYHGWRFGADGRCRLVPALGPDAAAVRAGLGAASGCAERHGYVWLAPDEPVGPIIDVDAPLASSALSASGADMVTIQMEPVDVCATAAQIVDNFLDIAHFPFVHAGTFGSGADVLVDPFDVQESTDGWGLVLDYQHTVANHEDPLVATGEHPLVQPRRMRYEFRAPLSATLLLDLPVMGMLNLLTLCCQPIDDTTTRVYMSMIRNDCATPAEQQAAAEFEMKVFAEDMRILEHLPWGMLLASNAQPSTRADRLTVAYRRVLRRLAEA